MRRLMVTFLAVAITLTACGKQEPKPKPKPPPPPRAALQLGEVRSLDAKDRPEAVAKANEQAALVVQALNSYYDQAFIDPKAWGAGAHPALATHFTAEAQPQVAPNLGGLALADLAPKIKTVVPAAQKVDKISFLIDEDLSASSVVATISFTAIGKTAKKADGPVDISHKATFLLTPEAGTYKIAGFFTELKADTKTKKAAFGLSWMSTS